MTSGGAADAAPAAFAFTLDGDLAGWQRRGTAWLPEPPEIDLQGDIRLAVGGRVDLQHVEIHQANWNSKPIQISTPSLSISESEMLGNFKGRVDSSDLTRLQVEALQVRATSFSIGAKDAASADGVGRTGQAVMLVDLNQLLNNITPAGHTTGRPGHNFARSCAGRQAGRDGSSQIPDPMGGQTRTGRVGNDCYWRKHPADQSFPGCAATHAAVGRTEHHFPS